MPRPARPWFRFYSEQLENRKSQNLRRDEPVLYGYWIQMLCLANLSKVRGVLPSIEDIAFALRPDPEDVVGAVVEQLVARKFLDRKGGKLAIHQWEEWQKDSDARATEGRRKRGDSAADAPQNRRNSAAVAPHRSEESKRKKEIRGEETHARDPLSDPIDQLVADFAAIGTTNARTVRLIEEAVDDYSLERVQAAVSKAAGSNVEGLVPWNYIVSILEGKGDNANNRSNTAAQLPAIPDDPDAPGYKNPRRVSTRRAVGGTPGADTAPDAAGVGDDR